MTKQFLSTILSNLRVAWPFFLRCDHHYRQGGGHRKGDPKTQLQQRLEKDLHLFVKTDLSLAAGSRITSRRKGRKPGESLDP